MTDNKNNEMVFELPASQKQLFWILIGIMAVMFAYLLFFSGIPSLHRASFGIMAIIAIGVLVWLLIPSLSYRYVITDEKMVYSGKNFWLQDEEKEVLLKDIAKAEHTPMFFKLYDKYDTVIFKAYVNNFITPRVYEELNKRIDLSHLNKH